MRKMDDPYDATKDSEEPESLFGEVALRAAGAVIPLANVIDTVRDHFSQAAAAKQVPASAEGSTARYRRKNRGKSDEDRRGSL